MSEMLKKIFSLFSEQVILHSHLKNFRNKLEFQAAVYQLHVGRKKEAQGYFI